MAFGLSSDPTRTLMVGADATVAWVDRQARANAVDYHLSGYIQVHGAHAVTAYLMEPVPHCSDYIIRASWPCMCACTSACLLFIYINQGK